MKIGTKVRMVNCLEAGERIKMEIIEKLKRCKCGYMPYIYEGARHDGIISMYGYGIKCGNCEKQTGGWFSKDLAVDKWNEMAELE